MNSWWLKWKVYSFICCCFCLEQMVVVMTNLEKLKRNHYSAMKMFPAISGIYEEGNKSRRAKPQKYPQADFSVLLIQKIKIKLTKVKEVENIQKVRLKMVDLIGDIFKWKVL